MRVLSLNELERLAYIENWPDYPLIAYMWQVADVWHRRETMYRHA